MIGSFGVYRPPLNSIWSARACFGDCLALLLSLFWELLGPLWVTLGSFGTHFGTPGDALGSLGGAVGASWGSIGHLVSTGPLRKLKALKYRACAQKQACWNLLGGPGGPGGPGDPGETVHELQFRTYPPHAPGIRMT